MDEKKYTIDGEPASAHDIIHMAEQYGYSSWVKMTSEAAGILRENGHTVGYNNQTTV